MDQAQATPACISVREAARYLGISARHAYELFEEQQLPGAVWLGRRIVVYKARLEEWLQQKAGVVAPRPEPAGSRWRAGVTKRGSETVSRRAHNPETAGPTPAPATKPATPPAPRPGRRKAEIVDVRLYRGR